MATEVFVYGTLRPGEHNYVRYLAHEGAKLIAKEVYTWPEYGLVSLGGFPAMVIPDEASKDTVTAVVGDVFVVDSPTLRALDRLEGVPTLYQRMRVKLANGMQPYAYIMDRNRVPNQAPVISHGDWCRYIKEKR